MKRPENVTAWVSTWREYADHLEQQAREDADTIIKLTKSYALVEQQLSTLLEAAQRLDVALDKYIEDQSKPMNLLHKHGVLKAALLEQK